MCPVNTPHCSAPPPAIHGFVTFIYIFTIIYNSDSIHLDKIDVLKQNVDLGLCIQAFNVHVQAFRYLLCSQRRRVDGVVWRTLDGPLSSWHLVIKIVYSQLGNIWCELHPLNATMKFNIRSQHLLLSMHFLNESLVRALILLI